MRYFVVTAMRAHRADKVKELFELYGELLLSAKDGGATWHAWFSLPYITKPESDPRFQVRWSEWWRTARVAGALAVAACVVVGGRSVGGGHDCSARKGGSRLRGWCLDMVIQVPVSLLACRLWAAFKKQEQLWEICTSLSLVALEVDLLATRGFPGHAPFATARTGLQLRKRLPSLLNFFPA